MADQLTGLKISKQPTPTKLNCTNCGRAGHLTSNCWGKCPTCDQLGHRQKSCRLTEQERRKIERARKRKLKAVLKQRNLRRKANEPNFKLTLPDDDDSEGNHWIDSLNDSRETVAELPGEDSHWTTSNRMEPVEGSQGDSEEEDASDRVMKVKEYINSISDEDIKTAIDMI